MIRLLLLLLLVAAAATAAAWFADNPGQVAVDWLGYRAQTSVAAIAFLLAALFFAGMALQRLVTLLRRDLPFSKEKRDRRREARGYFALNRAMVALAAGDQRQAGKLTQKAVRLLPPQPLTHIMAAEAAKLGDDHPAAAAHYRALTEDREAAFLGLRGLVNEAMAASRVQEARRLARQAVDLRPKSRWALRTLFALDVGAADWTAAEQTLQAARKAGAFERAEADRHRAALLYCRAVEADLTGKSAEAGKLSREALKLRPGFVPAAGLAARIDIAAGNRKRAERLLRAAWRETPHPTLLEAYDTLEESETPHARFKRVQSLVAERREHVESRIAEASAALAASRRDIAREALEPLRNAGDGRAYCLLAELAEGEQDLEGAAHWRARAAESYGAPAWVCNGCGARREKWTPLCASCGRFDSFDWQSRRLLAMPRPAPGDGGLTLLEATPSDAVAAETAPEPDPEPSFAPKHKSPPH